MLVAYDHGFGLSVVGRLTGLFFPLVDLPELLDLTFVGLHDFLGILIMHLVLLCSILSGFLCITCPEFLELFHRSFQFLDLLFQRCLRFKLLSSCFDPSLEFILNRADFLSL
ncbi:hypothetical protein N7G274_007356 [Stereocaulon virgatum]|uniref:Uncharacterized protein n=1 Tax=Stereocaulon virgatum TaxID=373712 RepID=A0ABR4A9C0_9LECA